MRAAVALLVAIAVVLVAPASALAHKLTREQAVAAAQQRAQQYASQESEGGAARVLSCERVSFRRNGRLMESDHAFNCRIAWSYTDAGAYREYDPGNEEQSEGTAEGDFVEESRSCTAEGVVKFASHLRHDVKDHIGSVSCGPFFSDPTD